MNCSACGKELATGLIGVFVRLRGRICRIVIHNADVPVRFRKANIKDVDTARDKSEVIIIPANRMLGSIDNSWQGVASSELEEAQANANAEYISEFDLFKLYPKLSGDLAQQVVAGAARA